MGVIRASREVLIRFNGRSVADNLSKMGGSSNIKAFAAHLSLALIKTRVE